MTTLNLKPYTVTWSPRYADQYDIALNGQAQPLHDRELLMPEDLATLLNDAYTKGVEAGTHQSQWVSNDVASTWPEGSTVASCWVIDGKLDLKSITSSGYHRPDWCDRKHERYEKHTEDRRYMLVVKS